MVKTHKSHYLTPNRDTGKPEFHIFFDVETKPEPIDSKRTRHVPYLGWALFWRRRPEREKDTLEWFYFESPAPFWDFVERHTSEKNTLYLISHNISFDLGVLDGFKELEKRNWVLKNLYSKGMTSIIHYVKGKRKIIVLDNGNYFKVSLADLGKAIGIDKLEIDFTTCSKEELSLYCKRDVEILYRAWQVWFNFCDTHNLGKWGYTLPSQAMNAFRHRFMKHKLLVHKDPQTLELEREAYRGGRTSAFFVGELEKGNFYKLDINSAYPWAMKQHKIPTRHLFTTNRVSLRELATWLEYNCVIAKVELETDDNPFPLHYNGHNIYPVGKFETTLTTPELEYALSKGWIKRVIKAAVYHWDYCFDEYVDFFYGLKQKYAQENNKPFYFITKLFLNSLYGKFGQKATKFKIYGKADDVINESMGVIDTKTGKQYDLYRFGDTLWIEVEEGESYNSMPAIAAHITAYVRMYLFQLRNQAGKENCFYCDTDSLMVNEEGYHKLAPYLDPLELGKLKVEGKTNHIIIKVPKNYCFGGKWTRKGIPPNAKEVAPNTWEFEKFHSIRGIAKQPPELGYFTEKTQRKLNYVLYDGIVNPNGWVTPFKAHELKPSKEFPPEVAQRLWEIEMQIAALKEARRLPQTLIFTLWDYRRGCWKRARDSMGNLVPLEYSKYDSVATEYGFDCLDSMLDAIQTQIQINKDIAKLYREAKLLVQYRIKEETPLEDNEEIPF